MRYHCMKVHSPSAVSPNRSSETLREFCFRIISVMANVDIFVGNETLIDPDVYQLWLDGYTGKEFDGFNSIFESER